MSDCCAQDAGAVGVIVIGLDLMNETARAAALAPRAGMRPSAIPGASATVAGATISRAAAQQLFGRAVDRLAIGQRGSRVSANWHYDWTPTTTPAHNMVAMLPGYDPTLAAEYVLVGAHSDHVGTTGAPVDHDSLRAVNTVTRRQGANDLACQPMAEQ